MSKIRYLQVTHIPFMRRGNEIIVDSLWANDLKALVRYVGPLRVVAPELTESDSHQTWGPTETILDSSSGITFVGFQPISSTRDLIGILKMRSLLRQQVDWAELVHTSNPFPPYLGLMEAHNYAVSLKKKTIFAIAEDYQDMIEWEWVRLADSTFKRWRRNYQVYKMNCLVEEAARTASLTFLFTPAAIHLHRLQTKNGVALRDVTHAKEDVITEESLQKKCQAIREGKRLVIVAACRHKPLKGLDLLIRAIAVLKQWRISVHVHLYGHGSATKDLKELVQKLELQQEVDFPGHLNPGKELYEALSEADICAMPHRTNDFARAFYDAMAGGAPVIAFDTLASRGTVRHGVDGLLATQDNVIAYATAIRRVHEDRNLLIKMAKQARERALCETQEIWMQYRAEWIRELFS